MELRILLGGLRRAAIPAVAFAILGLVLGVLLARPTSDRATARATLLLSPQAGQPNPAPFTGDPDRYVADQISILESQPTAVAAAALVPDASANEIRTSVSLRQRPESDVVEVVARSASPQRSQQLADAVTAAYINQARAVADQDLKRRLSTINSRLDEIRTTLTEVEDRTGDEQPSPADAVAQMTLLREYDQLQAARLRAAEAREDMRDATVIEPAVVLESEGLENAALGGAFGFLVAAAIGAGLAAMWTAASGRVLDRRQAEFLLGRPVLTEVTVEPERPSLSAEVPKKMQPAIEQLAVALAAGRPEPLPRTVAVGSTAPGEESEAVAVALASVLAREATRVAFLSLDRGRTVTPSDPSSSRTSSENFLSLDGDRSLGRATGGIDVLVARQGESHSVEWQTVLVPRQGESHSVDWQSVEDLRKTLEPHVDVVVIHLAALLQSRASVGVAREAEDFVLIVPAPRQRESDLALIRQVLLEPSERRVHVVVARQRRPASR